MSKLGKQIAKGTLDSRLKERNIKRTIRKMQKSERGLLLEVRKLLENNQKDQATILAQNIITSRKTIQQLGRLQFYVKSIQSFYRQAQLALIKGETIDTIARSLTAVNRILSIESFDQTLDAIETELETLDISLDQATEILEDFSDPLVNTDVYIDNIINELENAEPEQIQSKISDIVSTENILPKIPEEILDQREMSKLEN